MATGYGITGKGKHNSAGEELQDIDWDNIPPEKRGMGTASGKPQPKMKADAVLADPDPFNESQLPPEDLAESNDNDYSQIPLRERKKSASVEAVDLDKQDDGAELGAAQVKQNKKKVTDPTNGTKTKKVPLLGKN